MRLSCKFDRKELTEDGTFEGYGSVFDVLDSDREIVMPGAFAESIREKGAKGIKMLRQHDHRDPIGVWLEVKEDERGLFVRGQLALEATAGKDTHALMKIGALDGLSIGFSTRKAEMDEESRIRKLIDLDLWEVSPVTFPANSHAVISAVKSADDIETIRDFEGFLRDAGYSKQRAKAIAACGFGTDDRWDADDEFRAELASQLGELSESIREGV